MGEEEQNKKNIPFFFYLEVVVHPIISPRTTTSNLTLPEGSYTPKNNCLNLEVVVQQIQQTTTLMRDACSSTGDPSYYS